MKKLVNRLDKLCDSLPFQTSWHLQHLVTGERADRMGDVPVPSASTRKISILMAALKAVSQGKLDLGQRVTPFRDALVQMIIVSDNTCTGTVVDLVGLDSVRNYCEEIGLTRTVHRFGIPPRLGREHTLEQVTTTTPSDQVVLLALILRATTDSDVAARLGVTTELARLGLDILSWQKLKTRLDALGK